MYDCAVDWVSLEPELMLESKMDATWYTPQSLHNSSCCELFSVVSKAGAEAIVVVGEDTIGVDEAGAVSIVDEDATPDRLVGARVEGRKTPHLLR